MGQLKTLAGQTAVYGLSSIVGRLLNYLLVPLYTRIFAPEDYGVVSEFYAYITFLMVILALGLETAFFHFVNKKQKQDNVFGNAQFMLMCSTGFITILLLLFSTAIATFLGYPNHAEYVQWFALIMAFDTLTMLPFARLRQQNKPFRFAMIKLVGIFINIALNVLFLLIFPKYFPGIVDPTIGIGYVFIANLAASGITLVLLFPELRSMKFEIDKALIREMLIYGFPILIAGFAGMINETLDRAILKYLITDKSIAMQQLGIYSACYKLSILMTLFVQTFRYAADPFYFSQQHKENSKKLFANVMNYFVLVGCIIFLGVMYYLDIVKHFIGENYFEGLKVVPILLAANLFLGIYLNMSIWYKLSGNTRYGAWLSIIGAIITIVFNLWLIPIMGYMGSAWATFICYTSMMLLSYWKGQKVFPIPYETGKILLLLISALVFWQGFELLKSNLEFSLATGWVLGGILLLVYFAAMWKMLGGRGKFSLLR